MEPQRERYRKLPGHRRGILRGASLWLGSDHLLSVKSVRFREEYKRFHLRDVQAIVVASVPRFHLSTRAIGVACLWAVVFLSTRNLAPWIPAALGSAAMCLVCAWVVLSNNGCRCRIYTAVSSDELPSIYRTWTARKFLAEVEPRIREVQGVLESDWAEAIENRDVGPPGTTRLIPSASPATLLTSPAVPVAVPSPETGTHSRTPVSDVFVASLFGDALLNLATLHSMTRTVQWIWYALAFVQIGGAILIFLQHHRGILKAGMQKLAIATLIAMGVSYYLRQVLAGLPAGSRTVLPDPAALATMPGYILIREVDAAVYLALGIAGVAMMLTARDDGEQPRSFMS
ncbi:MAG TPA: hypothetical protein VGZ73_15185 [Bryobacteraceae bacterium]|jgi:hypothetical protein|nr:hypothetical protein [Bryobacteraceae bacterium]